jgi:hypothetical protein
MQGTQQLFYAFHELLLHGWPNYGAYIKGRHPKALIEEVNHWQATFPDLLAFKLNCRFPRVFLEDTPTAPVGALAGARLLKHVPGSQQFPIVTLKPPSKTHMTKHLKCMTAQTANRIFEDYMESIDQDRRSTPIMHRGEVWGNIRDLQRLFL